MNNAITATKGDTTAEIAINRIIKNYTSFIARNRVCTTFRILTTISQHPQSA